MNSVTVKSARLRANLTQGQLATMSGVEQSFISRLETGEILHLSHSVVAKIAQLAPALQAKAEELVSAEMFARHEAALKRAREVEDSMTQQDNHIYRTSTGQAFKRSALGEARRVPEQDLGTADLPDGAFRRNDGAVFIRDASGRAQQIR
jgi:transcriptional regulator with XRE-family HTH domain